MDQIFMLLGGAISAFIFVFFLRKWRQKNHKDIDDKIEFGSSIYSIGIDVIRTTLIDRVSIVITHNGDGVPYSGIPLYARQTGFMTDDKHDGRGVDFKFPIELDLETVSLLNELRKADTKARLVRTVDLPTKSMLKALYEKEGVIVSIICYLERTSHVTYFCSFACYDSEAVSDKEINAVRIASEKLRVQIRKMYGQGNYGRTNPSR